MGIFWWLVAVVLGSAFIYGFDAIIADHLIGVATEDPTVYRITIMLMYVARAFVALLAASIINGIRGKGFRVVLK